MGARGPRPTPNKILNLRGSWRGKVNKREPKPRPGSPSCPPHLDAEAKREWRRVVRDLTAVGLLTHVDRAALAAYCANWSRWVKAEKDLAKRGEILISANTGGEYQNPWLAIANGAQEKMAKFLAEFGMSPSSRAKLQIAPPDKEEEDPLDRLAGGKPLTG